MSILISKFNRWRHSRGFGIHSPFAFRFVTDVLCQPLPYYSYSKLGKDKRLRLLFRLVVEFKPQKVYIISSQPEILEYTVSLAFPDVVFNSDKPDMLVIDAADTPVERYKSLFANGAHALVINASGKEAVEIKKAVQRGMTFDNRKGSIVVAAHNHLPRQNFDVFFA